MRCNLKNFWHYYDADKINEWFEVFQAELREMPLQNADCYRCYKKLIREILGE